jgi:uncharacterized protein
MPDRARAADRLDGLADSRDGASKNCLAADRAVLRHECLAIGGGPDFRRLAHRLWPMLAGVVLGTLAGTGLLTGSHAGQAAIALGLLLMLYAVLGLTSVRFSVAPAAEWWLGPLIGVLTGLVTAATGVFVIPAVPYLGALNLGRKT